ncbi:hypothetical protein [Cyclobacterium xiamenense]|jgi:hypothetical protein|uniref:hypothetical protein n=1 Tax=Cyclobacterium xiamenense TaxID=1297121 RepID=UPI0012B9F767|nr:hypothetical protein [Cyclobacterium xiamenense]
MSKLSAEIKKEFQKPAPILIKSAKNGFIFGGYALMGGAFLRLQERQETLFSGVGNGYPSKSKAP